MRVTWQRASRAEGPPLPAPPPITITAVGPFGLEGRGEDLKQLVTR
jgi:hypothetical protein